MVVRGIGLMIWVVSIVFMLVIVFCIFRVRK